LEDYELDEARIKLLKELKRIPEAAEIHVKNGNALKAVEMLTASAAHNADHVRLAVKHILIGLWRDLTLEVLPASNPTVSGLLVLADRLNKSTMTQQEVDEVVSPPVFSWRSHDLALQLAMFKAIRHADHVSLRTLAKTFIRTENDPAALLCLDHVFSSPLKLQNLPLVQIQTSLSLYLGYVRLLNKFYNVKSLVEDSNHQKLFGFLVLGENRYLVPKHTVLYEKLTNRSTSGKKSTDGHSCDYGELSQGITQLISSRISGRTGVLDSACRDVHGFSPCLHLLFQNKCNPPKGKEQCTFQHIQPEQLTVDWYHARLRLILLQFQILDGARYYDWHVKKYVPALCVRCGILIKRKATGLGYYTWRFTHLFRDSDRSLTSTSLVYQRDSMASGSYENGFDVSVTTLGIALQNRHWTDLGSDSLSHAHWPSILIGKMPSISPLARRCIAQRCGRDPRLVARGVSSSRILSYL